MESEAKVLYHWIIESHSETCVFGKHEIGPGEKVLVVHFPRAYMAFCAEHGDRLGLP